MKILFFISVHGHGSGGHFHSLNHISRKLSEQNDVRIVSIGPGFSRIISQNPYFYKHVFYNGLNFLHLSAEIKEIIDVFKPDVFHCFDMGCYNVLRLWIDSRSNKIVVNKCGGKNPLDYPHVSNLVLFSQENLDWFNCNDKFEKINIYLIPNRVKALTLKNNYNPVKKDNNSFNFLRICRIGFSYRKSIEDSIRLIEHLHREGLFHAKLYLCGVVENETFFKEIQQNELVVNNHLVLLTDSEYTSEASKMLYIADAVIGTGRGGMEAASLGKPLLAINAEDDYPILITPDSFADAFKTNFSERNVFNSHTNAQNLRKIKLMIEDKSYYSELTIFSNSMFNKYFDLGKVPKAYMDVYMSATFCKRKLLRDINFIFRGISNFFRSYLRLRKR